LTTQLLVNHPFSVTLPWPGDFSDQEEICAFGFCGPISWQDFVIDE